MSVVNLIPKAEAAEVAIRWEPKSFDIFTAVAREMKHPRKRKTSLSASERESHVEVEEHPLPLLSPEPDEPEEENAHFSFVKEHEIEDAEVVEVTPETEEAPMAAMPVIDEEELVRLREEARREGFHAGFNEGKSAGYEEGKREGYEAGKEEGIETGKDEGRTEGHKTGYYAGYEEGTARGYEEGNAKGLAEGTEKGHEEGLQKGREEGHQEGYEAGFKEGNAEGAERANQLAVIMESFKERLVNAEQDFAEDLLALATQIADQIIMTALHIQPELLLPVVRQAIQTLPQTNQPIRIAVNERDVPIIQSFLDEQGIQDHCTVVSDSTVEPGGCKIESESSLIDATLKNRRERVLSSIGIYRDWLENRGA